MFSVDRKRDIISIVMFRIHLSLLKKLRNNFRKSSNPMIRWIYDHFWRISRPWIPRDSKTWIPWNWRPTYSYWSEHLTTTKKTYDNPTFCKGVPVTCIGALTFTFIPKSIHVYLFFPFTRNLAFSFLWWNNSRSIIQIISVKLNENSSIDKWIQR